ncbi:tRNA (adenosine(37)-N6)-threonylcarbamoyltransferase complex ATPase subunit type 1 TsaE [Stieleria sp. JC731]|uniref:tRNA (adenosine(37)-N6)-threonylcarbamoyltransferase complex ATPase subunit type 1 TsaE n=1 Tax=Pirellulaceae TaxID=2691357 RepID=UPI001E29B0F9|nr:tRNA (adenosine(37)-N6)-threonylcarbamoyltransferase complex ATPase subunit type 1 TsaE [Stieleria sp. JC731]MCC9600635.1 tRNA (adenosine(37)-N6)-threonylcarbamoyltransferase complex ATPase subunit type 1 TsaE [Stieleria sp. JC731]
MAQIDNVDLAKLKRVAHAFVQFFPAQLTIGLVGTLGAGKTTLTQNIASAAGIDPEDVTSPTFTLLSSYAANVAAGPITLHHLDAYRVHDEDEFLELGVEELFDSQESWVLIEWADKVEAVMPRNTLWITIEPTDPRSLLLRCDDQNIQHALRQIQSTVEAAS